MLTSTKLQYPTALCLAALLSVACTSHEADNEHWYAKKDQHEHAAHWTYDGPTGPEHWGDLSPDYVLAKTGRQQSPIDIDESAVVPGDLGDLEFDYQEEDAVFVNNGHSIQHDEGPGSWLVFNGQRYRLIQFHFHTPSEHTVGGEHAPMEAHLVHRNDEGQLLVVGVFVRAGSGAPAMEVPGDQLPGTAGSTIQASGTVNPGRFVSPEGGYYSYPGSLTTPPCTEGVTWIILRDEAEIPASLLAKFQQIMGDNNRPVQPLCGRKITGK